MDSIPIYAIGTVSCARKKPEDDDWDAFPATIKLDQTLFGPDALVGLDAYSHVEVLFLFHAATEKPETGARHPRGRADWPKVGIFAQRGKDRPNHIGATICRVVKLEGTHLHVTGLDAIDGTPVLDIKPVWSGFLPRGEFQEPAWAKTLMEEYWQKKKTIASDGL